MLVPLLPEDCLRAALGVLLESTFPSPNLHRLGSAHLLVLKILQIRDLLSLIDPSEFSATTASSVAPSVEAWRGTVRPGEMVVRCPEGCVTKFFHPATAERDHTVRIRSLKWAAPWSDGVGESSLSLEGNKWTVMSVVFL